MSYAIDPEIEPMLEMMPLLDFSDIPAVRELMNSGSGGPDLAPRPGVAVERIAAGEAPDSPPVDLVVVRPESADAPAPLCLWFHGGGFAIGAASESVPFLTAAVERCGMVAVSVEYDLAPEATYPTPIDQGASALTWLLDHAVELGIDPDLVVVGGQSAGAAHAAGLTIRLRDQNGPRIAFQLLDVPVTDDRASTQSASDYGDTPVWTTTHVELSWRAYLGETEDAVIPARVDDLAGLPPAFIAVSQFDPLRDEGIEYARRLAHANVPTELHLYPGTYHGSASLAPKAAVSRRHNNDMIDALCRAVTSDQKGHDS